MALRSRSRTLNFLCLVFTVSISEKLWLIWIMFDMNRYKILKCFIKEKLNCRRAFLSGDRSYYYWNLYLPYMIGEQQRPESGTVYLSRSMTKPKNITWPVRPAKAQISLSCMKKPWVLATHWEHSEDSAVPSPLLYMNGQGHRLGIFMLKFCVKVFRTSLFPNPLMYLVHVWYGPKFHAVPSPPPTWP